MRSDIFKVVKIWTVVFWVMMSCSFVGTQSKDLHTLNAMFMNNICICFKETQDTEQCKMQQQNLKHSEVRSYEHYTFVTNDQNQVILAIT